MKQYLLSVYHPEDGIFEPEAVEKITADIAALNTELQQAGAWVFAGGLYPSSTATVVRVQGGDGRGHRLGSDPAAVRPARGGRTQPGGGS
jgi:hypothetical protein